MNDFEKLGLGFKRRVYEMTEVISCGEEIRVTAGRHHTLIHLVRSNQLMASGFNSDGQLGIRDPPDERFGLSVSNLSHQTIVREFVLLDYKFDKRISHVLCGRGTSVSFELVFNFSINSYHINTTLDYCNTNRF